MACGYCKKDNSNPTIRVMITSRGQTFEGWAHKTCLRKWRKISEVAVIDKDSASKSWFESLRDAARKSERAYEERKRGSKTCPVCGVQIHRQSKFCHTHARDGVDYTQRGKLTPEEIVAIRDSDASQSELARLHNVSVSTISNIVNGKAWKNVK